jgi:hypothetical protein
MVQTSLEKTVLVGMAVLYMGRYESRRLTI